MSHPVIDQLTKVRCEQGLSQAALARRLGVTQTALSYWESGKRDVSFADVARWAHALGLIRPLRRARNWAHWRLRLGTPGRLTQALILVLLPDMTVPLLWHRVRHGAYPTPPPRRPAPQLAKRWREKITDPDGDT